MKAAQENGEEHGTLGFAGAVGGGGGVALGLVEDQAARLRALVQEVAPKTVNSNGVEVDDGAAQSAAVVADQIAHSPECRAGAKIISVSSGKGGVGKTNTAVNLCIALARLGARVTLLDADLGTANADLLCGVTPAARLEHVIHPAPSFDGGYRRLRDIVIDAPGGFRLAPGTAGVARMADLGLEQRGQLLSQLEQLGADMDVLVIDTGAGVGVAITSFMDAADLALVVTTPEPTAVADAYAVIKCDLWRRRDAGIVVDRRGSKFALLVNQAFDGHEARAVHTKVANVCGRFLGMELPFAGWIEQDPHVPESVRAKRPYMLHSPDCHASRDIQRIAGRLAQQLGLSDLHPPRVIVPDGKRGRLARLFRRPVAV